MQKMVYLRHDNQVLARKFMLFDSFTQDHLLEHKSHEMLVDPASQKIHLR
jgi:hypothetical protein